MQPYQQASEEITRQKNAPGQFLKKASIAIPALAGGGAAISRILPFLSEMIPTNLAAKGLAKIDPRMGKFIDGAVAAGHTINDAVGFVRDKIGGDSSQKPAQTDRSIIEQYSPELFQFLKEKIGMGLTPVQAAMEAHKDKKFREIMRNIEREHNLQGDIFGFIESTFGGGQGAGNEGQLQPNATTPGKGQQALMAILQKIQQQRGAGG